VIITIPKEKIKHSHDLIERDIFKNSKNADIFLLNVNFLYWGPDGLRLVLRGLTDLPDDDN
jgi:hypothetical protein